MKYILPIFCLLFIITTTAAEDISPEVEATINHEIDRKVDCLARNMYFEARGEGFLGILAVAHVTINRVLSKNYPNTICDVVYQKYQFEWTRYDYSIRNIELFNKIKQIAYDVIMGKTKDPTHGATNFHHISINPGWNCRTTIVIRNHNFCR